MLRYLRVGVSALSLIACVLLIALWVRSYWRCDQIDIPLSSGFGVSVESVRGQMAWWDYDKPGPHWKAWSQSVEDWLGHEPVVNEYFDFPPHQGLRVSGGIAWVPYWFPVVVTAIVAIVPWIKWRFGIREMLIAVTLVAVLLGILAISK